MALRPRPTVLLLAVALRAGAVVRAGTEEGGGSAAPPAVRTEGQSGVRQLARRARRALDRMAKAGFYPTFRSLAQGTGIGPGLTFWKPKPFGSPLGIMATVGWSPQALLLEARLGRIPARPGARVPDRRFTIEALTTYPPEGSNHRVFAFAEARRLDIIDDRIYYQSGPGGEPRPVVFERRLRLQDRAEETGTIPFDVSDENYDFVAGYHFARGVAASARMGYVRTRTTFAPAEIEQAPGLAVIPGVNETTSFTRTQLDLVFDRRDRRNRARRGAMAEVQWLHMDEQEGSIYGFDRARFDTRGFVSDRSRRHTLALRVTGSRDSTKEGRLVPFYFQESLGGGRLLRSYPNFRFRGTRILAFSTEYRYAFPKWIELAAFYDGGEVWSEVEALGSQGYRDSVGVGIRWVTTSDVLLRLETAHGDEGWRVAVRGSFSF